MKIKEFLGKLNRASTDVTVEICDCNISLDNRTRISADDLWHGRYGDFSGMKLQSYTIRNGVLTVYAV